MVFNGYHKLPDETAAAKARDGCFKTGDLGHLDADGYLFITGRKKDMLIVGGENVYPREIEELICQLPAAAECAVVGRPDPTRGEVPVAFIVPAEGEPLEAQAIKDHLRDQGVQAFKIPKDVFVVDELPKSPTGKVLKRELREKATTNPADQPVAAG
jgi:acyl-CoA synthetase (AMP-forming)/AMP-acid ligase II